MSDIQSTIENLVTENKIVLFMKGDKQMPHVGSVHARSAP